MVAIALSTAIGSVHFAASIAARWHSLEATAVMALSNGLAVIVGLAIAIASCLSKQHRFVTLPLTLFCLTFVTAVLVSRSVAAAQRDQEIAVLVRQGIVADCENVMSRHRQHSDLVREGYVRFLPGSKEFDALPDSIKAFQPVYVTIEENPFGSDLPLNVGLCKMGFGGFHMGVRVFRTDPRIKTSWDRKRYLPNVYLWIDET